MTSRTGTKCPHCPKIVYGRASQWDAHARTHTYLAARRRRWVNTTPWWEWTYELITPDPSAPRLWVQRTPANWLEGVKTTYVVHRVTGDRSESMVLAATGLRQAKREAAALLEVADWGPMLSVQGGRAA